MRILLAAALLATGVSGPPPVQRPKGMRPGPPVPSPRQPPAERVPEPAPEQPAPEPAPEQPPPAQPPPAQPPTDQPPPELPPSEPVEPLETPGFEIPPEPKSDVPGRDRSRADPFDPSVRPPAPRRRIDPIDLPPPRSSRRPPPPPPPPPKRTSVGREGSFRELAVAVMPSTEYAVTYAQGVSAGLGIFLGSVLRPRQAIYDRPWRTAVGYQFDIDYDASAVVLMRHRVMATGHGGDRGRLFYQLGGGVGTGLEGWFFLGAAARIGLAVPEPQWSLNGLVIGGSVAMDGAVLVDPTPILRLGLFVGWAWI